jgi:cell division protein FtsW
MDSPQNAELSTVEEAEKIKKKKRTDTYIWGIYFAMITFSIIELFSASIQEVTATDIYGPIMRHMKFVVGGLVIMLILQRTHFKNIYKAIPFYVFFSVLTMILVLAVGVDVNGARRGLMIGPLMLLPAEFLKLAVALGVAFIVTRFQIKGTHDITTGGAVLCGFFIGGCSLLLFFHGLTNTLLVVAISIAMMGVGFFSKKLFIVIGVLAVLGLSAVGYKVMHKSADGPSPKQIEMARLNHEEVGEVIGEGRGTTWRKRISDHLRWDKYKDTITDENKQAQLSFIAQAHGGLRGVGIGNSRENTRLPLAFSDYIFAIVVEELGMVLSLFVLALYLWLLYHAGRLATHLKSTLASLLVIGCAVTITFQALFHIAIVTGVFPVSGQPLPLFSKGGSSVIATSIALGIMLSVSRSAVRIDDDAETQEQELKTLPEQLRKDNPAQKIMKNE